MCLCALKSPPSVQLLTDLQCLEKLLESNTHASTYSKACTYVYMHAGEYTHPYHAYAQKKCFSPSLRFCLLESCLHSGWVLSLCLKYPSHMMLLTDLSLTQKMWLSSSSASLFLTSYWDLHLTYPAVFLSNWYKMVPSFLLRESWFLDNTRKILRNITKGKRNRIYLQMIKGSILQWPKRSVFKYKFNISNSVKLTYATETKGKVYPDACSLLFVWHRVLLCSQGGLEVLISLPLSPRYWEFRHQA